MPVAEILLFQPHPRLPAEPMIARQRLVTVPRADLEETAHAALDAVEKLIAILDAIDGDPDAEPGGDDEPSLGAPEEHGNTIAWFRGTARDLELDQQPEISP